MSDNPIDLAQIESEILIDEVSDAALEASAEMTPKGLPCTGAPFLAATFGASPC